MNKGETDSLVNVLKCATVLAGNHALVRPRGVSVDRILAGMPQWLAENSAGNSLDKAMAIVVELVCAMAEEASQMGPDLSKN
jgi:hypothetical protein